MKTAERMWDYLRLGQEVRNAECILVFGGHDLGVGRRAAELYNSSVASLILVSGGSAHVPSGSRFPTEADAIADIVVSHGAPESAIVVERLASNTSENFWFSAETLRDRRLRFQDFLVVQKPYCERRTIATARRRWPDANVRITSEVVSFDQYCDADIPVQRILSMITGELVRLDSYSRSGLIEVTEPPPEDLLTAAHELQLAGFNARALAFL